MQYRSGNNPHEPLYNDKRARAWKFIIRGAFYARLPEAFSPHVNYCAWIASPQGRSTRWLIRGYIQTTNPRNYHTLKTRYSKQAEWIPVDYLDQRVFAEFSTDPIPHNAVRLTTGIPLRMPSVHQTVPLHKVGLNIDVPDLTEDYHVVLWQEEQDAAADPVFEEQERQRKSLKRKRQEEADAILAAREAEYDSTSHEHFVVDYFGVRHYVGTTLPGGRYVAAHNKSLGRFND